MRADGRRIKTLDPLFDIIPHIMPKRCNSQVSSDIEIDYSLIRTYTRAKKKEGNNILFMTVLIAAYLRMCALVPELNRFILNKKTYSRNEFTVSFVTLRDGDVRDDQLESLVKLKLNYTDTLFEISEKINAEVEKGRSIAELTATDKLVQFFMGIPLIPGFIIKFVMWLDKIGMLPKIVLDGSPFHSSLFITNMASINMNAVYHHLYEFGTNSVFLAIGKLSSKPTVTNPKRKVMSIRGVVDERICAGATYARAHEVFQKYLKNPELLETALKEDEIVQDID